MHPLDIKMETRAYPQLPIARRKIVSFSPGRLENSILSYTIDRGGRKEYVCLFAYVSIENWAKDSVLKS